MKFWYDRMEYLRAFAAGHRVLQMGPGLEDRLGVTVDRLTVLKPTVCSDLSRTPYPFRDDTFDAVYAFSVIEHLPDFFAVMSEIHRILRPDGFVALLTPHFSNDASFVDPSHVLHLSMRSFDYLIEGSDLFRSFGFYTQLKFRLRTRLLMLEPPWCWIPGLHIAVNHWVAFYERHLCYIVRGRGMYFELEAVKAKCG